MRRRPSPLSPLSTVLVALDFTPRARAAVDRALALPLAPAAAVELVHVVPTRHPVARQALETELARARARAGERVTITSALLRGDPSAQIVRRARAIGADLVVVGRHGHHPLRQLFVGSTAARVVRASTVPVLVVCAAATAAYRRPLVATDLGPATRQLVELALRVTGADTALRVLHARGSPRAAPAATATRRDRDEAPAGRVRQARGQLVAMFATLPDGVRWSAAIDQGDPRLSIAREAHRSDSDLLVMGTHRRSGLAGATSSSVAETTIATAPCDVLVATRDRARFAPRLRCVTLPG